MAYPLRFGLLADIQLADKDNTHFEGRTRLHREVASKLASAVDALLEAHDDDAASDGRGGLAAVVSLGDLVDGYPEAPDTDAARSASDLAAVLSELSRLEARGARVLHAIGNHDLSVPRRELAAALGLPAGSSGYYSARLAEGWRVVVLDTTDVSIYGHPKGSPEAAAAEAWLARLAAAAAPNAQPWNGGASDAQLGWLRRELAAASDAGERVIVACHHPLVSGSAPDHYLAWNAAEITAAFDAHPGLVPLVLTGHFHAGGHVQVNGTHYVTLEGLVESPSGSTSFAVIDVSPEEGLITIAGGGYASTRALPLPPAPAGRAAAAAVAAAAAEPHAAPAHAAAAARPRAVAGQA
ncbi:hypothetical protein Rsub_04954 [Raphidocelis subcapitata]|uniref:Calcineurin-like phosphoesterase domain-containing protein n=1 Tax=Raphidocelis subcapitata TaxID=307507 RepID=A0A2V0NWY5_9CHLO|nr:hypothetical protein Rsub_04954 [Raphidocelis subcapitata]|eukprot:GBF91849.1 hypothetical protein Rsub_04954 [Raphidocelis subcapitata]